MPERPGTHLERCASKKTANTARNQFEMTFVVRVMAVLLKHIFVIEDACGRHTAAPVILAWLSLWVVGGLCLACPCGRFVFRQGLGRSWQILADLGQNNLLDRFWVHWGPQAAPGPPQGCPRLSQASLWAPLGLLLALLGTLLGSFWYHFRLWRPFASPWPP